MNSLEGLDLTANEVFRFTGSDNCLNTEVGKRIGPYIVSTGKAGYLFFGPYICLSAGLYRVLIFGTVYGHDGVKASVDVVANRCVLAESVLDGNGLLVNLLISLDAPCNDFEVRVWVYSHSKVTVSLVEIQPCLDMGKNEEAPLLIGQSASPLTRKNMPFLLESRGDGKRGKGPDDTQRRDPKTLLHVSPDSTRGSLASTSPGTAGGQVILENVTKQYSTRQGSRTVLNEINLQVAKGEKIGILGRNGAGKSTLIRLISGAELATSGRIHRGLSVSWPLAFGGAFQGSLTGLDNLRFICRIYGAEIEPAIPFVEEFSELGAYLREPVKTYSSGMRARLAFAISMAVEFDCFLIDEIIAVGDSRFTEKCQFELFEKRKDRAMIIVSHSADFVLQNCQHAAVLVAGKLRRFDAVDDALAYYHVHAGE